VIHICGASDKMLKGAADAAEQAKKAWHAQGI
jgi:hypothetical protein